MKSRPSVGGLSVLVRVCAAARAEGWLTWHIALRQREGENRLMEREMQRKRAPAEETNLPIGIFTAHLLVLVLSNVPI